MVQLLLHPLDNDDPSLHHLRETHGETTTELRRVNPQNRLNPRKDRTGTGAAAELHRQPALAIE